MQRQVKLNVRIKKKRLSLQRGCVSFKMRRPFYVFCGYYYLDIKRRDQIFITEMIYDYQKLLLKLLFILVMCKESNKVCLN